MIAVGFLVAGISVIGSVLFKLERWTKAITIALLVVAQIGAVCSIIAQGPGVVCFILSFLVATNITSLLYTVAGR
jgi:hypothetical protein